MDVDLYKARIQTEQHSNSWSSVLFSGKSLDDSLSCTMAVK